MRFRYLLYFLYFFLFGGLALAQTTVVENSGFAPGNLWFSKEPDKVGETIKVYTLVWNASKEDISGAVTFFDNDALFGKQSFVLAGEGSSKILSVPWTVGEGYHKIYAQITESSSGARGKSASRVSLQYTKTIEAEQFVSAPKPEGGATTTTSNYISDKINYAEGYAEANLPKPLTTTAKGVTGTLESARDAGVSWSSEKVSSLKNELNTDNSEKTESNQADGWYGTERPLKYVAMFLLSIMSYVLGNSWLSYGLLLVFIFFILRFVKRKFFF